MSHHLSDSQAYRIYHHERLRLGINTDNFLGILVPFELIIINSAEYVVLLETGEVISSTIPKPQQLVNTLALTLCYTGEALRPEELLFLRQAVKYSRRDMAELLDHDVLDLVEYEEHASTPGYECDLRDAVSGMLSKQLPWLDPSSNRFTPKEYRARYSAGNLVAPIMSYTTTHATAQLVPQQTHPANLIWKVTFNVEPANVTIPPPPTLSTDSSLSI